MTKSRSRAVDHLGFIKRTLEELSGYATLAFELIQNADDSEATWLRFDIRDEALWVEDNGGFSDCGDQDLPPDDCPFVDSHGHRCDFHSFRLLSGADKRAREDTTGAMGIGFTAVYQVSDLPEIISGRRHWIVDETTPEDDRIKEEELDPLHDGTRIILPWAQDSKSPFRVRVGAAPAPPDVGDRLLSALDEALAPAMLFLRNVETIELALNGEVSRRVERTVEDHDVLIDDAGEERRWRMLEGDFEDEARDLRARHGSLIEEGRLPNVAVAVPHGFDVDGRLCATLPTATPSGLSIHVNAELYLKSDRRELAMGTEHQLDWNSAALETAAELLADALGELPELLGPTRLWQTLGAARQIADSQTDVVSEALGAFWECLEPEIPEHDLVWTGDERWVSVSAARYAQHSEDEVSFGVLESLGLDLVNPELRPMQNILLAVDVSRLAIDDIAEALRAIGLDEATPIDELPGPSDSEGKRIELWSQLGRMIGRFTTQEQRAGARDALEDAAVMPSLAGELAPVETVWRTDAKSLELFHRIAPDAPFLDVAQLPPEAMPLAELCDPLEPAGAIDQFGGEELKLTLADARALVAWFARREEDLGEDDRANLAGLGVFPSSDGFHPLSELALPGDFDDPLDLALVVDEQVAREHGAFLQRLGIEQLSFSLYAGEQVPRAFDDGELTLEQRRNVVSLLAQRRGELDDAPEAQTALAEQDIIECTDGIWRNPSETYFESSAVIDVLGLDGAFAAIPDEHAGAVQELFAWLGVADQPRPADVVARAEHISQQPVTDANRQTVERMVRWLGAQWPLLEGGRRDEFAALRSTSWLPTRNSSEWHEPAGLDLTFRAYLYESQGNFLAVRQSAQAEATDFLRWLGLKDDPSVGQVVDHLRHCADTDTQPNYQVYDFLDSHADAGEIGALAGIGCLHIQGRWRKPSEVFWTDPGFDRWRVRLGHEFLRYRALFDQLGVKEAPDARDAIAVMRDVSAEYGPANAPLGEVDRYVLLECWRLCDAELSRSELDAEELAELGGEKVVADDRSVLMAPSVIYFEDLPGLADELPDIRQHVIRRPDGAWRAMQAAGVSDLSKVAVANVVEVGDRLDDDDLHSRLADREEELARVIAPGSAVPWREFSEQMRDLTWVVVTSLTIAWELEAFERRFPGEARDAEALWQRQEDKLYVALGNGAPVWEGVARELVRALLPEVEPASLALGIAAALGHDDREAARRALDAAGYAQLAPELKAEILTTTATDLDAEEAPESGHYGDGEGERDDDIEDGEPAGSEEEADDHPVDSEDEPGDGKQAEGEQEEQADGDEEGTPAAAGSGSSGEGRVGSSAGNRGVHQGDGSGGGAANGKPPSERRSRLRSYVIPGDAESPEGASSDREDPRTEVDEAGIAAVEHFERESGRIPEVKPHNNKGFDVLSTYSDGEIARYIEVKSKRGAWDEFGVGVTDAQFEHAQLVEHQFWLYVVEYALSPERRRIWCISDPAGHITDFMFDGGWKGLADPDGGAPAPDVGSPSSEPVPSEP